MVEAAKPVKRSTDWESIERDYRAGILSIREVAKLHGVSDTAIRKRATANDWQRDLTDKVADKVRSELVRGEVRTANPQTEREIVEVAAATVVQVVRSHRKKITQGMAVIELLTQQLMDAATTREDLEDEVEEMTKDDRTSERRARLMKALSLQTHSSVAVNLSAAHKTWIGLERQNFSIKDDTAPDVKDPLAELLASLNGTSLKIR